MSFIEWCNNNQGFINAILSMSTILISIVAVCISLMVAYLPYRKRIVINPIFGLNKYGYYLELDIANSGNKLIGIKYIDIKYKNKTIGDTCKRRFVEPSKTTKFYIKLDINDQELQYDIDAWADIEICDTEGKEYKFKTPIAMG